MSESWDLKIAKIRISQTIVEVRSFFSLWKELQLIIPLLLGLVPSIEPFLTTRHWNITTKMFHTFFFMYSHKAPYEKTCITQIFYLINFVGLIKGQKLYKRIPLNCIKYVIEEYLLIYRHPLGLAQKICKGLKLVTT